MIGAGCGGIVGLAVGAFCALVVLTAVGEYGPKEGFLIAAAPGAFGAFIGGWIGSMVDEWRKKPNEPARRTDEIATETKTQDQEPPSQTNNTGHG
jgi:MFS family permease